MLQYCIGTPAEVARWSVAKGSPDGVSVMANNNVLIAVRDCGHLVIFTPTGQVVKEIKLPSELVNPRHALQFDNEEFLLCHGWGGSAYGICVVGSDGRIIKSASSSSSSAASAAADGGLPAPKSFTPTHLTLDRHGNILAAEFTGSAIQLYNKRLHYITDVVARSSGLKQPFRLCLGTASGRLYVGEYSGGGRVLVFGK